MFEIRIICDPDHNELALNALSRAFSLASTRQYPTRDGKRVRVYATAARALVSSPWPTPQSAYGKAPSIVTEIGWVARAAADVAATAEGPGREYFVRKAALLDRVALVDEPELPGGTATDAAMSAAFALLDLDNEPTPGDVRGYVRAQYQDWREQQYQAEHREDAAPERCGESGCLCYGIGAEHADHACGCDCPRCPACQQLTDNCDCEH